MMDIDDLLTREIDYLIEAYVKAFSFNQQLLFDLKKMKVNYIFLEMILEYLTLNEDDFFR